MVEPAGFSWSKNWLLPIIILHPAEKDNKRHFSARYDQLISCIGFGPSCPYQKQCFCPQHINMSREDQAAKAFDTLASDITRENHVSWTRYPETPSRANIFIFHLLFTKSLVISLTPFTSLPGAQSEIFLACALQSCSMRLFNEHSHLNANYLHLFTPLTDCQRCSSASLLSLAAREAKLSLALFGRKACSAYGRPPVWSAD